MLDLAWFEVTEEVKGLIIVNHQLQRWPALSIKLNTSPAPKFILAKS